MEIAAGDGAISTIMSVTNSPTASCIFNEGSDSQKEKFLKQAVDEEDATKASGTTLRVNFINGFELVLHCTRNHCAYFYPVLDIGEAGAVPCDTMRMPLRIG